MTPVKKEGLNNLGHSLKYNSSKRLDSKLSVVRLTHPETCNLFNPGADGTSTSLSELLFVKYKSSSSNCLNNFKSMSLLEQLFKLRYRRLYGPEKTTRDIL